MELLLEGWKQWLLAPPGLLYRGAVALRIGLYRRGQAAARSTGAGQLSSQCRRVQSAMGARPEPDASRVSSGAAATTTIHPGR